MAEKKPPRRPEDSKFTCVWRDVTLGKKELTQNEKKLHQRLRQELEWMRENILEDHQTWVYEKYLPATAKGRTPSDPPHDLSGINLSGSTLEKADLRGANLGEAKLSGANLERAKLAEAKLWLADLSNANLKEADLYGAKLSMANLSNTDLLGANLSYANLEKANLYRANLDETNMHKVELTDAEISKARLSQADLSEAIMVRVKLSGTHMPYADLYKADLEEADLSGAFLLKANLSDAKCHKANLSSSKLGFAKLISSVLVGANLSGAWLEGANLSGANLSDADLRGADLRSANFSNADVAKLKYNCQTKFLGCQVATCYGSQSFQRFALQQNYLEEMLLEGAKWWAKTKYYAWLVSSNFGRSALLWGAWCALFALIFAFVFRFGLGPEAFDIHQAGGCHLSMKLDADWVAMDLAQVGAGGTAERQGLPGDFWTMLYYSVITFTTLGFGDVVPLTPWASFWVAFEVILGYIGLGGFIAIMGKKLARFA